MRLLIFSVMAAALCGVSCGPSSGDARALPPALPAASSADSDSSAVSCPLPTGSNPRAIVYYFHRTLRCVECLEMEALTVRALDYFPEEQREGRVSLRILNVEEPENERFVDEFDIYFNTIIVAREDGGRTTWKDLGERAWELAPNRDEFIAFLVNEVAGYLPET